MSSELKRKTRSNRDKFAKLADMCDSENQNKPTVTPSGVNKSNHFENFEFLKAPRFFWSSGPNQIWVLFFSFKLLKRSFKIS